MPMRLWSLVSSHEATRVLVVEVVEPGLRERRRHGLTCSPAVWRRAWPAAAPAARFADARSDFMYSMSAITLSSFTSPWKVGISG